MTSLHAPQKIIQTGVLCIESIDDLVYIVLERMICNGVKLTKHKGGKTVLTAAKVFREIWRDKVLRDLYLDLCDCEFHVCRDHGPLIVRNHMIKIAGTQTPVGEFLRAIIFGREYSPCEACEEIVSLLNRGSSESSPPSTSQ